MAGACSRSASNKQSTTVNTPQVVLRASDGRSFAIDVEIADTEAKRRQGLMYREHLAEFDGMFFIMENTRRQSFWMRNVPIPLDMLFIDEDLYIVGIVRNAAPYTDTSRAVATPSRYVLELRGGFCDTHKISAGSQIQVKHLDLPAASR